jgi:hypothetical protein
MAKIMGFKMPMLIVDPSKQSPMWLSPSLVQLLEHPYSASSYLMDRRVWEIVACS